MKVTLKAGKLTKSTSKSVGYDLYSTEDVFLPPGAQALVPTGVVTEMENCFALVLDRSGLAAKFRVNRRAGVIDADYSGIWNVVLVNENREPYQVRAGDRIAQCIFLRQEAVEFVVEGGEVIESGETRNGGLGSTGK